MKPFQTLKNHLAMHLTRERDEMKIWKLTVERPRKAGMLSRIASLATDSVMHAFAHTSPSQAGNTPALATLAYASLFITLHLLYFLRLIPHATTLYYTASLRSLQPDDFLHHCVLFFAYMVCLATLLSLALWGIAHLFATCLTRLGRTLHIPTCAHFVADRITLPFVMILGETIITIVLVLEGKLLNDMGVHLLDVNLIEAIGLQRVLARQQELGAGIDPDHRAYVVPALLGCISLAVGAYFACKALVKRFARCFARLAVLGLVLALLPSALLFNLYPALLVYKVPEFKTALPFFVQQSGHISGNLKVGVVNSADKLLESNFTGYPILETEQTDDFPRVRNRKNVIILVQESQRNDAWMDQYSSGHTLRFTRNNNCIKPEENWSTAHVTEMSVFSFLFGIAPCLSISFCRARIPSFPLDVLRKNDYVIGGISASTLWMYPNKHLVSSFDEYPEVHDNAGVKAEIDSFLQRRREDKRNFMLYIHMHKGEVPGIQAKDVDRVLVLEKLRAAGVLDDNSILFITSDHGDMFGEHDEFGHGQPESSWWNEKVLLPLWVCFPGPSGSSELSKYETNIPSSSGTVDIVPTWMTYLSLDKPVAPHIYSHGVSLLQPKGVAFDRNRHFFFCPRYFPEKNKILAVADSTTKLWFRTSQDEASGHLLFHALKLTDHNDKDLCSEVDVPEAYNSLLKTKSWTPGQVPLRTAKTNSKDSKCPLMWRAAVGLELFESDFISRFMDLGK